MEIQVMIKDQFPLRERQYTKNGEKKTFASKGFVLTDGMNEFYAELTGDKARNCGVMDVMNTYMVQLEMHHRSYTTLAGEEAHTTDININHIKQFGL